MFLSFQIKTMVVTIELYSRVIVKSKLKLKILENAFRDIYMFIYVCVRVKSQSDKKQKQEIMIILKLSHMETSHTILE
jgi:hypothetical protein